MLWLEINDMISRNPGPYNGMGLAYIWRPRIHKPLGFSSLNSNLNFFHPTSTTAEFGRTPPRRPDRAPLQAPACCLFDD